MFRGFIVMVSTNPDVVTGRKRILHFGAREIQGWSRPALATTVTTFLEPDPEAFFDSARTQEIPGELAFTG